MMPSLAGLTLKIAAAIAFASNGIPDILFSIDRELPRPKHDLRKLGLLASGNDRDTNGFERLARSAGKREPGGASRRVHMIRLRLANDWWQVH